MKIIISLTTIFDRQKYCSQALKSLLSQTILADEIRLYVSSGPYLLDKGIQPYSLEPSLLDIVSKNKQISVEWVENQGPYRKLLPSLRRYWQQDVLIITCDDDVEYKSDFLEKAVSLYTEKQCCIGFQGTRINNTFDYNSFQDAKDTQDLWNLPKGVGGILYNPKWFSNLSIFEVNPKWKNDDLWFVAWRIASGVECYIAKESSLKKSFATKTTLWSNYNETTNTAYFQEIIELFLWEGWLSENLIKFP